VTLMIRHSPIEIAIVWQCTIVSLATMYAAAGSICHTSSTYENACSDIVKVRYWYCYVLHYCLGLGSWILDVDVM